LGRVQGKEKVMTILKKALRDQDEAVRATVGGAVGRALLSTASPDNSLRKD